MNRCAWARNLIVAVAALMLLPWHAPAGAAPTVAFDETGRLVIDGKPTFPVGIYIAIEPVWLADPAKRARAIAELDDLKNSPYDIVINYGDPDGSIEQMRQLLDLMHERGLKSIFSVKDLFADMGRQWGKSEQNLRFAPGGIYAGRDEDQVVREVVRAIKDHPAVIGWYTSDEPKLVEPILQHHRRVKEEDPTHPALVVMNHWEEKILKPFIDAGAADVFGVDPYPVPHRPLTHVSDAVAALRRQQPAGRPAWAILQTFGDYVYKTEVRDAETRGHSIPLPPDAIRANNRAPTPREMRAMTYLALAEGATGIIMYYYKDIMLSYDAPQRWAAVKAIGQELKEISPILLMKDEASYNDSEKRITGDNPEIHWRIKSDANQRCLILANASAQTQSIVLKFAEPLKQASFRAGTGLAYPHQKELLVTVDGYEGAVIELK